MTNYKLMMAKKILQRVVFGALISLIPLSGLGIIAIVLFQWILSH